MGKWKPRKPFKSPQRRAGVEAHRGQLRGLMTGDAGKLEWMSPGDGPHVPEGLQRVQAIREEDVHDLSTAAFLFGRESAEFDRISKRLIQGAIDRWIMEALEHGPEEADRRQRARAEEAQARMDREDDAILGPCGWCGLLPSAHIDGTICPRAAEDEDERDEDHATIPD